MLADSLDESAFKEPQPARSPHLVGIFLACCVLLGLGLRVAMAARSGLWRDEAQFLWIVRIPTISGMIDFLWHHESHPPLYYLLMRAWQGVFGDSDTSALALSILFGLMMIPVIYRVGRRVFSPATGLIAAALVTTSPIMVKYSAMVRPYSLLPLLCLLSIYSLWSGLKRGDARSWIGHAAVTLGMLLTHNWAWIVLGAEWGVVASWFLRQRRTTDWNVVRSWVLSQIAILVGFAPWLMTFLYQARNAGYDNLPLNPIVAFGYISEVVLSLPVHVAMPACFVLILATAWRRSTRTAAIFFRGDNWQLERVSFVGIPLAALGLAVVLSTRKYMLHPQCFTAIAPCFLLVVGFAIVSLSSMPRTLAVVVWSFYLGFTFNDMGAIKSNAREAAATVACQSNITDLILITPVWLASPFNYYYSQSNPQSNYPYAERIGAIYYDNLRRQLLDPGPFARVMGRMVNAHDEGRRVWFVSSKENLTDDAPASEGSPEFANLHYGHVGHARAIQIKTHLDALFGSPRQIAVPMEDRDGLEVMQVFLYSRQDAPQRTMADRGRQGRSK